MRKITSEHKAIKEHMCTPLLAGITDMVMAILDEESP